MTQVEKFDAGFMSENVIVAPAELNAPAATAGRRRFGSLGPLVVLGGILVLWYAVHYLLLEEGRRFILPLPHVILSRGFIEGVTVGGLLDVGQKVLSDLVPFASFEGDPDRDVVLVDGLLGLWMTVKVSFVGLVVAAIFAVAGAMLMSQSRMIEKAFL